MFTFTNEFINGALIGFVLGLLVNWLICNSQLNRTGTIPKTGKSRNLRLITTLSANNTYSPEVETLWIYFKRLYDERFKLDPTFSFNKMAFEINNLLDKQKTIVAYTIRNFYLRRTSPRKKIIDAIQHWVNEEKAAGDSEIKELDDSDKVIDNSKSKEDNKT